MSNYRPNGPKSLAGKRNTENMAEYECVQQCVVWVEVSGETVEKLYYPYDEDMESEVELWKLTVPQGTIVCKHFAPYNDLAAHDRDDQMENPGKYVKDEHDIILLAEIMVKLGFFKDKYKSDEKGKRIIDKFAVEAGKDAIKDLLGEDSVIEQTPERMRIAAIEKLSAKSRKDLGQILRDGGVTGFFRGAEPEALAEIVYDNGLYEAT